MNSKLAIFDVDGTLFDGNVGIEFLKSLVRENIFPADTAKEILGWYAKYKNDEVDKSEAVDEIYKLYAEGMKGIDARLVKSVAVQTFNACISSVFPFAIELIAAAKQKGCTVILLSGSPVEMVELLAEHLGADIVVLAGTIEITNDTYTGTILSYPGSAQQKKKTLLDFITTHNLTVDWKNSLAMGDNERDELILGMVGTAYAFEPNELLKHSAVLHNFTITNRDSILSTVLASNSQ